MRIWSIHPRYLDPRGLTALWREGLLAQKVLLGRTKGYRHHPQLLRFRTSSNPAGAVAAYLLGVADQADARGYNFDRNRILSTPDFTKMPVSSGQIAFEWKHLMDKLKKRSPNIFDLYKSVDRVEVHPLFTIVPGDVESWEVIPASGT